MDNHRNGSKPPTRDCDIPSGDLLHSYGTWPSRKFVSLFPLKMVIYHSYVSLPEGNSLLWKIICVSERESDCQNCRYPMAPGNHMIFICPCSEAKYQHRLIRPPSWFSGAAAPACASLLTLICWFGMLSQTECRPIAASEGREASKQTSHILLSPSLFIYILVVTYTTWPMLWRLHGSECQVWSLLKILQMPWLRGTYMTALVTRSWEVLSFYDHLVRFSSGSCHEDLAQGFHISLREDLVEILLKSSRRGSCSKILLDPSGLVFVCRFFRDAHRKLWFDDLVILYLDLCTNTRSCSWSCDHA